MALEDDFEEKTEEATDERKKEFRQKGEVAQSREFTSVFALLGALVFFSLYGLYFLDELKKIMIFVFTQSIKTAFSIHDASMLFSLLAQMVGKALFPLFSLVFVMVLVAGLSQTKMNFSWQRMKPNFGKMNPLSGMKRFFSTQVAMELLKSIAKITTVAFISYSVLGGEIYTIPKLGGVAIDGLWGYWGSVIFNIFLRVLAVLVLISGIDFFYNWVTLQKKMKMTKQNVKDELKNREGDPLIKRRIRDVQRQLSRSRMIQNMDKATVLVTNPTHFAVALQYEQGMKAPVVVAKGQDFLALKLREVAKEKEIPIVEDKPLARTLYKMLKVGQEIPETLYKAVSEVIAYVYRLKNGINRSVN